MAKMRGGLGSGAWRRTSLSLEDGAVLSSRGCVNPAVMTSRAEWKPAPVREWMRAIRLLKCTGVGFAVAERVKETSFI